MNLIDRLERKYAKKIQLRAEQRRQYVKSALRAMRGRQLENTRGRISRRYFQA